MRSTTTRLKACVVAATLALAALTGCSASDSDTTADGLAKVKLQLQWFKQGQFAGYLAAVSQGFYREQGLEVEILDGGTDIVPQTVLAQGQADYAIAWVPKALASREAGAGITNVAQIFQRSGTKQVSFKSAGISGPAQLRGKKVGNWGYGNEFELFAGMTQAGLNPAEDVTLVQQQFDMNAFLSRDIDAAQAMSYNEYAQLLETKNPATGKLYTADDFTTIDWNDQGVAMLQDAIWANTEKLQDSAYADRTVKFIAASLKGWAFCRDNVAACRDLTVSAGSTLGASHQEWQITEVNKLIWPSPNGIGVVDKTAWDRTVSIAKTTRNQEGATVLTKDPDATAYTGDYVTKALDLLRSQGVDVVGAGYSPQPVTLAEGGK
ncbi:ABC transporter substrate-binding protein [Nocardia huaxiensis]|uniref:Thiamine pyrimidine synthase n=1 Tax=Nocardia huaxiensis TaxID=2755382 RepID=A0A7D6V7Y7_9NOCA|nr:ABC transporter substrate-binding protein [Nocardia huaxiensis]QLY27862.1 ABC transporter substrate-binding protein [Nocardia huaxiensis]UFS98740.1 ABC transporter substrate-binding protein [Nocardia huaxiensis]